MTIGFTGHRDATVDPCLFAALASEFPDALWIHGGAPGFDAQVDTEGKRRGVRLLVLRPDYKHVPEGWTQEGWVKVAPLKRNEVIVHRCDLLVACYDGRKTGGTWYTVEYARAAGKPLRIWTPHFTPRVPNDMKGL